jgi:hypothetical protein
VEDAINSPAASAAQRRPPRYSMPKLPSLARK